MGLYPKYTTTLSKMRPHKGYYEMNSSIFKQKSSYWRVFALCFFTAVLLFLPHCIIDAAAGGGMVCAVGSLYMAGEIRGCFGLK